MKPATSFSEKRSFGRKEILIPAIAIVSGRTHEACVIRNFSESGALLEFSSHVQTPAQFKLRISEKNAEAICEVQHRSGQQLGVRFLSGNIAAALERDVTPAVDHVQRFGAELPHSTVGPARRAEPLRQTTGGDLRRLLLKSAVA